MTSDSVLRNFFSYYSHRDVRTHVLEANDVFEILNSANLKPNRVETVALTAYFAYSKTGHLKILEITNSCDDPHRCELIGPFHPHDLRLPRTDIDQDEKHDHSHILRFFRSLGNSNIRSLTSLKISGIWIFVDDLANCFTKNPQLELLWVSGIQLSGSRSDIRPMADLLLRMRDFYDEGHLVNLNAEFEEVHCRIDDVDRPYFDIPSQNLSGSFSASQKQVHAWLKKDNDDLLALARSAFTVPSPSDEDDYDVMALLYRRL